MKFRMFAWIFVMITISIVFAQVNGEIIEQNLNIAREGYTVARFWGSHYEMGYAFGSLFADDIDNLVIELYSLIDDWGYSMTDIEYLMSTYTYKPEYILDEFQGIADGVNDHVIGSSVTASEIKVFNLFGDIAYACRSVSSWGSTVSSSEFSTISTRRLDYYDIGLDGQNHHVIAIFQPNDGTPDWINFAWPGFVTCATGLNEYGTIGSLHDYSGSGMVTSGASLPRVLACRWALSMVEDDDISTHLGTVYDSLSSYYCPTGGFLNYYVPDGYGGVIWHNNSAGYHEPRLPHPDCYGGEAIYTNNSNISGSSIGEPWGTYYSSNASSGNITMDGQWDVSGSSFHRLTIGYRSRGDIKIWFDGSLPFGTTPRVELEWLDILAIDEKIQIADSPVISVYPNPFNSAVFFSIAGFDLLEAAIYNIDGHKVCNIESGNSQWQPSHDTPSGVYYFKAMSSENEEISKRIVYLK